MNQSGYLFLGLTAIVAGLAAILTYAVLKFIGAARDLRKAGREYRDLGRHYSIASS
jgi:hypothetical protein